MIIKNLGPIKNLEIHLNQETILLGKNNTGKTYVSYLLYGVYKKLDSMKAEIFQEYVLHQATLDKSNFSISINKNKLIDFFKVESLTRLNAIIPDELPIIFNLGLDNFHDTEIKIEEKDLDFIISAAKNKELNVSVPRFNFNPTINGILKITSTDTTWKFELTDITSEELFPTNDRDEIINIDQEDIVKFFSNITTNYLARVIFGNPNIIYIPAERNGINVFRNELINKRSANTFDFEEEKQITTYPLPISDYMRYLNQLSFQRDEKIAKVLLSESHKSREQIWNNFSENILRGKYEFENETNEYFYRELLSVNTDGKLSFKKKRIPLKVSSSSTKSLFGLEYYLRFKFQPGDILFIDEPEMNLDPENQVKIAKLLVRLAGIGVRVVISTHSDYLTRATANQILGNKANSSASSEKENILDTNISGYYFERNDTQLIEDFASADYISNFDDMNIALEKEYFAIMEKLNDCE